MTGDWCIGGTTLVSNEYDTAFEGIAVKIGDKVIGTYQGLGGTFATFVDCCLRKKTLAGFHQKGLLSRAAVKDKTLTLTLSGNHSRPKRIEIMDIALQNVGAYPHKGVDTAFIIGVKSENKTKKGR
jgi:hypothetical protein